MNGAAPRWPARTECRGWCGRSTGRFQDLADAPLLEDCQRFPDRATVNDLLAFNRAYRRHIDVRQPVELARWWELRTILQETEQLYQVWDTVRDARCEYYYVTVRRQALKRLREMLGNDAIGGDQGAGDNSRKSVATPPDVECPPVPEVRKTTGR